MVEDKACNVSADGGTQLEDVGAVSKASVVLPVVSEAKQFMEQSLPTQITNLENTNLAGVSFADASSASSKFFMDLQNTVGAAGEPYLKPLFLLRVDPLLKGFACLSLC